MPEVAEASGRLSRRALLAGGAGLALAACSTPHRSRSPRRSPASPHPLGSPTAADWRALRRALTGRLVHPGDPGYPRAHRLYDPRFDHVRPAAVVAAVTPDDVSHAVRFAASHGLALALRAGGHSYLGASTGRGLVVDLRPMSEISVDARTGTATFGAGVALIDAYATLADHEVSIPAGSCPTVGLTGLALGGGIGVVCRRYGLTCDQMLAADVVTATGEQLAVDARHHPDLFWALRGGGGSFAAVTRLTLRTFPATSLAVFDLHWDWSAAPGVLRAWMPWCTAVPDALWSTCHLLATDGPGPPTVSVSGVYVGTATAVAPYLDHLVRDSGTTTTTRYLADRGFLDTMLLEAGCDHETVAVCHLTGTGPAARVPRTSFVAASALFTGPIPAAGVAAVVRAVERRQADPRLGTGGVGFDALGGAVAAVAPHASAFVHRDARFGAQWSASWPVDDPAAQARNERSLAAMAETTRRYATGAYVNYPTVGRRDAPQAYWGSNLTRLREIKRRWDPTNVFDQPQGIT